VKPRAFAFILKTDMAIRFQALNACWNESGEKWQET
jgi:hypothetical protein